MKTFCKYLVLFSIVFYFSSCEKTFLGDNEKDTPQNNFEILWNDFDQHYGLFTARDRNWDSIYQAYQPQINNQTTNDELWTMFTDMLEYLDDGHTSIHDIPNKKNFSSGSFLNDKAKEEFKIALVRSKYLDELNNVDADSSFTYGKVKDKEVGYMHLFGMEESFEEKIDEVMNKLKNYKAIILDIRGNGGGDGDFAAALAGAFADGEHFIFTAQTRNGPNHNDFDEKTKFFTKPRGTEQYLKPVILLTDRYTISAAEEFLWHMTAFDHVTQMGDTSAGDLSDLSNLKFLPNGWVYLYSIQMYLTPEGKSIDGIGFIPDVYVKNTKADIDAGNDLVMERAFDYLKMEYGIE